MEKSTLKFPWLGYLVALFCTAFVLFISDKTLSSYVNAPAFLNKTEIKIAALVIVLFIILFEIIRFGRNRNDFDRQIQKYESQLSELLKSKNTLQTKVHKYAAHADKLKLFISDRLLEYIEYDEKFLHFKNIASEVRHNGVICYDKVTSALKTIIPEEQDTEQRKKYEDALKSMVYLWDLLDLSTTDNIAMYIANKLYECEEHYYRQSLEDEITDLPVSPTFPVRTAVINALSGFVHDSGGQLPEEDMEEPYYTYNDEKFWVDLDEAGSFLGTENYMILLVENLINNALYYSNSRKYGNKYSRINATLIKQHRNAVLSIYGSGPHIGDDIKDQIFQLGFSTKRTKGHNGKGLGLYFVKQIVTGYEGKIDFHNIHNIPDTYVIRIELANGDKINEIVETELTEDGKPVFKNGDNTSTRSEIQFKLEYKVVNIEVSVQSIKKTYDLNQFYSDVTTVLLDPQNPGMPRWCIEVSEHRTHNKVIFKPLDVTGVAFTIQIPTAESRLDPDFHELQSEELARLEQVDVDFEDVDQYVK